MNSSIVPTELSTPDGLADAILNQPDLSSYVAAFAAILKSEQKDLMEVLLMHTERLHSLGIPGFAFTLIRFLVLGGLIDTPAIVRDLCDPEYAWLIAKSDFVELDSFAASLTQNDSRMRDLGSALLNSLSAHASVVTSLDLMPDETWSDGDALLAVAVATRAGKCDLAMLNALAVRGPRLEAAAIACAPYCGSHGSNLIRECKTRILTSMNSARLYWFLTRAKKMQIPGLLSSEEFLHLLNTLPTEELGTLISSVSCVGQVSGAMLQEIALRAEDASLRLQCASALKYLCQRADEIGETITITTQSLHGLSRVVNRDLRDKA